MRGFHLIIGLCAVLGPAGVAHADYAGRGEVHEFIDELVREEGFSRDELAQVFGEARFKQSIVDAITRPAEKVLTWKDYQDIFLTEKRVADGARFMLENHRALIAAREQYGVPPVIVTAIIGVETMYGRYRGNYRVIDALSTLAFDYPPRAKFFRRELKHFLLLAREENTSPTEPLGSYAGAMGYGQFIPSSYRHYAVDFDGDGARDIWENPVDAIGSVANYLSRHGWREGELVTVRASALSSSAEALFGSELKPSVTLGELRPVGVASTVTVDDDVVVAPLRLEGKQGSEFWLGLPNFYVITRYNHSKLYAMAVFQLSERFQDPDLAGRY